MNNVKVDLNLMTKISFKLYRDNAPSKVVFSPLKYAVFNKITPDDYATKVPV